MIEALIALLLSDPAIAALVATRIYPGARPQGSSLAALVLNKISGAPVYTDDGESALTSMRVQIDAWGATYTEAELLARGVKARLSGFVGIQGAIDFRNTLIDAERDLRETGSNEPAYEFRTSVDFIVWYREI